MEAHVKDFHLPLNSRSVFSRIGVVPARKKITIIIIMIIFIVTIIRSRLRIRFPFLVFIEFIAPDRFCLSVPKNRNRRKIAAFSNRKVLNRRFCRKNRRKSPENRRRNRRKIASDSLGRGIEIAAFPRFQIAAFSGR